MNDEPSTPPGGTAAPPPPRAGAAAGAAAGVAAGLLPEVVIFGTIFQKRHRIECKKKKIVEPTRSSRASLTSENASDEKDHEGTGEHFRSGRRG